jgi:hypothetical protein
VKRRVPAIALWTIGFLVMAWPAALARNLGTDVLGNLAPASQLGGGALIDRYPLSAYSLDYHVDAGVTNVDGVPATIAHWAAAQLWSLTSFLIKTVIDLFTWAFSLDLLGGTSGGGALAPIADAISSIYENVLGETWMVAAIVAAGLWGIWKALVQRRYTETLGALAVSVAFVLIALFFVYQPQQTIGEASRWTNTVSLAFLSGANRGTIDRPEDAKRQVADHLFGTLVYEPWVVLEFGGLGHCVDTTRKDDDGYPTPVGPHDPRRTVCRNHLQAGHDGHGGFAPRFLRQPAGSDQRDREYEVLRDGELPFPMTRQFAGYQVDKADSPAVDIQQQGGAFQRLTLALVIFVGSLGAVILIGFLSLAVILAQVVALVLLGFAPVALVVGIFPGFGHDFFRGWLGKLATAVFIKALYSLVLAIVVAVSAALAGATDSLGFLFAFGLQTLFFWAIFLYRKQITARLVAVSTGGGKGQMPRMTVVQRGADIATKPFSALAGFAVGRASDRDGKQQSALAPEPAVNGSSEPGTAKGHAPSDAGAPAVPASNGHGPAASDGHGRVPANGHGPVPTNGHGPVPANGHGPVPTNGHGPVPTNGHGPAPRPVEPEPQGATVNAPAAPEPEPHAPSVHASFGSDVANARASAPDSGPLRRPSLADPPIAAGSSARLHEESADLRGLRAAPHPREERER